MCLYTVGTALSNLFTYCRMTEEPISIKKNNFEDYTHVLKFNMRYVV